MIKAIDFRGSVKIILFIIISSQLVTLSCSRKALHSPAAAGIKRPAEDPGRKIESPPSRPLAVTGNTVENPPAEAASMAAIMNIRGHAENKKLEAFWEAGIEKPLDTGGTSAGEIINTSRGYLGVPHCMGGTTKRCIDCSGLLLSVFAHHGIPLPHSSEEQARYGRIIPRMEHLREGDLVFFIRSYSTRRFITHSGIYIGNDAFIHTSTSRGVTITSLHDPWWKEKFVFGTRIFNH
jgi:murein DD-endopeptidase / murein LD-carboxypeptidase